MPALLVDTGNFFADDRATHGFLRVDAEVKNNWVLKAQEKFKVDVANVSAKELLYLSLLWERGEAEKVLGRFVSANVVPAESGMARLQPFKVVEIQDRFNPARRIRIAFIGLAGGDQQKVGDFRITDPLAAARQAVPAARRRADLVIVLAHMSAAEAENIASQVPGIDVMIVGNEQLFTLPSKVGKTKIVFTPYEMRIVGELRFSRDAAGGYLARDRYIVLDPLIPDDAEAAEMTAAQRQDVIALLKQLGAISNRADQINQISSQSCAGCHKREYLIWANSAHARALDKAAAKRAEFSQGCLKCHATITEASWIGGVQCEACHGPAKEHLASPGKGYGKISNLRALCSRCHAPEIDAQFDPQAYWERIKH